MDPLTHALTGAAVADIFGMPKRLGPKTVIFAMVAAVTPDLDVIPAMVAAFPPNLFEPMGLFDAGMMRLYHRAYTHALPFLLAMATVTGFTVWCRQGRKGKPLWWAFLALAALLSHSTLDMVNGGVRFWLPFSAASISWGQSPEGDPLLLVPLLLCWLFNHPPKFANRHGLVSLDALERFGAWGGDAVARGMIGSRSLAAITLAFIAVVIGCRIVE